MIQSPLFYHKQAYVTGVRVAPLCTRIYSSITTNTTLVRIVTPKTTKMKTPFEILESLEIVSERLCNMENPPEDNLVDMRDWSSDLVDMRGIINDMLEEVDSRLHDLAEDIREFNDGAYVECFGILYRVKGVCPDTFPLQYKIERVLFDQESTAHPILMLPFRDGSGFIPADTGAYGIPVSYSWVCDEYWGYVWKRNRG